MNDEQGAAESVYILLSFALLKGTLLPNGAYPGYPADCQKVYPILHSHYLVIDGS